MNCLFLGLPTLSSHFLLNDSCVSSVSVVPQAEVGAPGMVVGVSVDGAQVWCEGWYLQKKKKKKGASGWASASLLGLVHVIAFSVKRNLSNLFQPWEN